MEACGAHGPRFYSGGGEARGLPGWFRGLAALESLPDLSVFTGSFISSLSLWDSSSPPQPLSTRLSDVSDEVAKNFLSGGAGT